MGQKKNQSEKSVLDLFFDGVVEERCLHFNPGFEPFESFLTRQRKSVVAGFVELGEIVDNGLHLLCDSPLWSDEEREAYKALLLSQEKIQEAAERGFHRSMEEDYDGTPIVLADFLGLDASFYNKALDIGHQLLEEKRSDEAMKVFTALTQLNPFCSQFSQGLGYAFLDLGQNEAALGAFINALQVVDDDLAYRITLLVINTLVILGFKEQAKESLDILIAEIGEGESHADELAMAKELLATMT